MKSVIHLQPTKEGSDFKNQVNGVLRKSHWFQDCLSLDKQKPELHIMPALLLCPQQIGGKHTKMGQCCIQGKAWHDLSKMWWYASFRSCSIANKHPIWKSSYGIAELLYTRHFLDDNVVYFLSPAWYLCIIGLRAKSICFQRLWLGLATVFSSIECCLCQTSTKKQHQST